MLITDIILTGNLAMSSQEAGSNKKKDTLSRPPNLFLAWVGGYPPTGPPISIIPR